MSNPTNLMFFDTETIPSKVEDDGDTEYHSLWFGFTLAYHREGNNRKRIKEQVFHHPRQFWDILISRLEKNKPLYCFAHNLPFDLTIVDAWLSCDDLQISIDLAILDDPPIIIACTTPKGKVVFVDTFNYWKSSLQDIGNNVGMNKMIMPNHKVFGEDWIQYCRNDVHIIAKAIDQLIDWLTLNNLGSLKYTTPAIAMSVFKTKFMRDQSLLIHIDSNVLRLERDSYHGGLIMPYYIGEVTTPIYKYDVNSLYPYMMQKEMPTKLIDQYDMIAPHVLQSKMRQYGAVSMVTISSEKQPYPVVWQGKLIEAVGKYTIPLCGDELRHALDNGHVKACGHTALYTMEPIFRSYVEYFWNERQRYKKQQDQCGQMFCKLMLNSLYGKFAQRSSDWKELTYDTLSGIYSLAGLTIPPVYTDKSTLPTWSIGVHKWQPLGYPDTLRVRVLPNLMQVCVDKDEHHESLPIISSYVTSAARAHMRSLIDIIGRHNVYYIDTDSLFVTTKGRVILEKHQWVDPNTLGMLKLEGVSKHTIFYGPKDYIFDGQQTIKGIRKDAVKLEGGVYKQTTFEGLRSVFLRTPAPYIKIGKVTKHLSRQLNKGVKRPDGWVEYFRLDLI